MAGNKNSNSNSSTQRVVLGIIGMVGFGTFLAIAMVFWLIFSAMTVIFLPLSIVFALCFTLSGALLNSGIRLRNLISRLSRYMAELSVKNDILSVDDLTAVTGFLPNQIKKDMRQLKRLDLNFDLYTDTGETTLMKGKSAFDHYLDIKRQRDEQARDEAERQRRLSDPETATMETFRGECELAIDRIHAANLMLPGDEISAELSELEKTMKRIFGHIENHPEKLPETRKLMNYHLPTTMKLIEKYCQYDTMEYQPDNVTAAKADIEKALTAANEAFANFLEGLYHEDTLDITTDAEVLKKMFEKDGLTGKKFDI